VHGLVNDLDEAIDEIELLLPDLPLLEGNTW